MFIVHIDLSEEIMQGFQVKLLPTTVDPGPGPYWHFKNLGCQKSLIEKVKIITLNMYINK